MSGIKGIDWMGVAEPQADGYDADVAINLARVMYPRGYAKFHIGEVEIHRIEYAPGPDVTPGRVDHPNIQAAWELLGRSWPVARDSFNRLMYRFYPLEAEYIGRGSTCGSEDARLGEMYATTYSVAGL